MPNPYHYVRKGSRFFTIHSPDFGAKTEREYLGC